MKSEPDSIKLRNESGFIYSIESSGTYGNAITAVVIKERRTHRHSVQKPFTTLI